MSNLPDSQLTIPDGEYAGHVIDRGPGWVSFEDPQLPDLLFTALVYDDEWEHIEYVDVVVSDQIVCTRLHREAP